MFQAKQESSLEISENTDDHQEDGLGRKRRAEQDLSSSTSSQHHQMGSYLLQSSAGAIPASHHSQIPANFWMVTNSNNNQAMSGADPIWTFPTSVNNSGLYRSNMSSGLHFMNFPAPMALLPGQQFGSSSVQSGGGGDDDGNGGNSGGHLNMLTGLNPYRPAKESHHGGGGGGDDRHDTTSHDH